MFALVMTPNVCRRIFHLCGPLCNGGRASAADLSPTPAKRVRTRSPDAVRRSMEQKRIDRQKKRKTDMEKRLKERREGMNRAFWKGIGLVTFDDDPQVAPVQSEAMTQKPVLVTMIVNRPRRTKPTLKRKAGEDRGVETKTCGARERQATLGGERAEAPRERGRARTDATASEGQEKGRGAPAGMRTSCQETARRPIRGGAKTRA